MNWPVMSRQYGRNAQNGCRVDISGESGRLQGKGQVMLLAIVGIAILLRMPSLLNDGLWRDEANVYVQLIAPSFGEFLHRVMATEWHPPLFFVITYLWAKAAGTTELTLKILPFSFSVLTVPVVYRLGKTAASFRTGMLAATMYATAPLAVTYSTEYLYPLMGFLCTLLAWQVMDARRNQRLTIARFIGIAFVTMFVVYTHYVALFYVPMLVLWALTSRNGVRHGATLASALVLGMLPFAFWLPVFLNQRHIGVPYALQATTLDKVSFFSQTLIQYMPARPLALELFVLAAIVVALVALARSGSLVADPGVPGIIFVLGLLLISAENLLAPRYVLCLYGLLCVCLAWVIMAFISHLSSKDPMRWRRWGVGAVAALFAFAVIGNSADAFTNSTVPKSGIRSLVGARSLDPATLYIVAPDYLASTFGFYARNARVTSRGFVRWTDPEFFRLEGYAADWSKSDAVSSALSGVARETWSYKYLDVIVDEYAQDQGRVAYGKVWQLLNRLEGQYQLLSRTRYPGRYETVGEYRFLVRGWTKSGSISSGRVESPKTISWPTGRL